MDSLYQNKFAKQTVPNFFGQQSFYSSERSFRAETLGSERIFFA